MKFLVSGQASFILEVVEALKKAGISAKQEVPRDKPWDVDNNYVIGGTPKIRFTIYPHLNLTVPKVKLIVKGENFDFDDYQDVVVIVTVVLGVKESSGPLLGTDKVSYTWTGDC